jgi:hypothetical protein
MQTDILDDGARGSSWANSAGHSAALLFAMSQLRPLHGGPRVVDVPKKATPKVVVPTLETVEEKRKRIKQLRKRRK